VEMLDQLLYVDINSYLPETLLVKTDIASMAHSLEARSPFLDHEFMELTASMGSFLKLRNLKTKYLLRKIAKNFLPRKCINKRKQGFVPPLTYWFRGELSDYIKSELLGKYFLGFGLFDKNCLEQYIRENQQMVKDHTYMLWTLLTLKHWLEVWFRK